MWLYQGLEKMGQVAARDFLTKLIAMVLTLVVVRHESDYLWAAGLQASASAIAGGVSLALAPAICGVRFQRVPWREVTAALRQGWPVFLSMAAITLTSNTNVFILGQITSSTAEVAYFTNANRLIVAMRMLVGPIVQALYPHISHMASKSTGGAVAFLRKNSLLMSSPFLLMSIGACVFAPFVVHRLFGTRFDYSQSIPLLRIMSIQPFLLALSHCYATYYMLAFGFEKRWSRIILQSSILNFVLLGVLIYWMHVRPTTSMAIVGTALDFFVLSSSYYFFRTNTAKSHPVEPVSLSQA
jgi:PST family polysaccharide transporter